MIITPIYGELLILAMLAICCLRIYFIKEPRLDALALFSPFALLISILQILSWGINLNELIVFALSFIVSFTNYRALFRFLNHLYVDSYSKAFIISSSIMLCAILFFTVVLLIYIPRPLNPEKNQVKVETTYYSKDKNGIYAEPTSLFCKKNLKLTIYSPLELNQEKDTVVLFIPDKRAGEDAYQPYLVLLAQNGYKVYYGDFDFSNIQTISKFTPKFISRVNLIRAVNNSPSESQFFNLHLEYQNAYAKEFEVLSQIANKKEPLIKKFIIAGDASSIRCFYDIKNSPRTIKTFYDLSKTAGYTTQGLGFLEYSAPLYAKLFYQIESNYTYAVPSEAVTKTKQKIEEAK